MGKKITRRRRVRGGRKRDGNTEVTEVRKRKRGAGRAKAQRLQGMEGGKIGVVDGFMLD
jgi:hypothetical protein